MTPGQMDAKAANERKAVRKRIKETMGDINTKPAYRISGWLSYR